MTAPRYDERVVRLWAEGRTAWEITDELGLEPRTVFRHLARARQAGDPRARHRPQWSQRGDVAARRREVLASFGTLMIAS